MFNTMTFINVSTLNWIKRESFLTRAFPGLIFFPMWHVVRSEGNDSSESCVIRKRKGGCHSCHVSPAQTDRGYLLFSQSTLDVLINFNRIELYRVKSFQSGLAQVQ